MPHHNRTNSFKDFLAGKRVAVTGAAGTIGSKLVEYLLDFGVTEVRALDYSENGLFDLEHRVDGNGRLHCVLGDVRNLEILEHIFQGMDFVFHTAALKHVPSCERSPFEAVQTNIIGVQNVIRAARNTGVQKVLSTSSDKAVNPSNVMGTSKLMGERLMTSANVMSDGGGTVFSCCRFGNVAGSRGSVIPLFCEQIRKGGPITLTSREMTRFIMTLDQAIEMVILSLMWSCGGEVFVSKMPVVNIGDLAEVMVDVLTPAYEWPRGSIQVREIGVRPGEKFYEELISEEEVRRTHILSSFYCVLPAHRNIYGNIDFKYDQDMNELADDVYISAGTAPMSKAEIREFLLNEGVLEEALRQKLVKSSGKPATQVA